MEWEKIFANNINSKGLISRIYKQFNIYVCVCVCVRVYVYIYKLYSTGTKTEMYTNGTDRKHGDKSMHLWAPSL